MDPIEIADNPTPQSVARFRNWFAASLGISAQRKEAIYLELAQSTSLNDPAYWLQILFAAGIATLGLTLNSPAVIIGAMLISPLMGPILSSGLALAAGDVVLGLRALRILLLSCLAAVLFSMLLVGLLPFKELTSEIMARTQPNMLDLVVALFSGAIGALAVCKEVKGGVTSIPGVSIAVALMPPLCVTGYGLGVALTLNGEGLRVARGGGLLFLTNLVAITFAAMLFFLAVHLITDEVRESAREWHRQNLESLRTRRWLARLHLPSAFKNIGGLRERVLIILLPLILISIPLTQSLSQLRQELAQQQQQNRAQRAVGEVWQQNFARLANGETRSTLDSIESAETDGQLQLALRVITSQPYTAAERAQFIQQAAARLGRAPASVSLKLLELPTASAALTVRQREERRIESAPTVAQLQSRFAQGLETALLALRFPPTVEFVGWRSMSGTAESWQIVLAYSAERELSQDAQELIAADVRERCALPTARVTFEYLPRQLAQLNFTRNQTALSTPQRLALDRVGQWAQSYPTLQFELTANTEQTESPALAAQRALAVSAYLQSQWQVATERLRVAPRTGTTRTVELDLKTSSKAR